MSHTKATWGWAASKEKWEGVQENKPTARCHVARGKRLVRSSMVAAVNRRAFADNDLCWRGVVCKSHRFHPFVSSPSLMTVCLDFIPPSGRDEPEQLRIWKPEGSVSGSSRWILFEASKLRWTVNDGMTCMRVFWDPLGRGRQGPSSAAILEPSTFTLGSPEFLSIPFKYPQILSVFSLSGLRCRSLKSTATFLFFFHFFPEKTFHVLSQKVSIFVNPP